VPGWAERAAEQSCKPREFLRLLLGTRAERDAVHGNGRALDDDGHLMAILRFSVFGWLAGVGGRRSRLASGAAAIPINQGGCGAGQAPVPADGDLGMPVIRPACSGSVIREVVIRRAPERGLVRYQPFLVPNVD
jgi:hypothetical protein